MKEELRKVMVGGREYVMSWREFVEEWEKEGEDVVKEIWESSERVEEVEMCCGEEMEIVGYSSVYGLMKDGGIEVKKCGKCGRRLEGGYVKREDWIRKK